MRSIQVLSVRVTLLILLLHKCTSNLVQCNAKARECPVSEAILPYLAWPSDLHFKNETNYWTLKPEYLSSSFQDLISTNGCVANAEDPDRARTVGEIIVSRGYKYEDHDVITNDGYILTVQRIIKPRAPKSRHRPVLLQHGLMSSSLDWVLNSREIKSVTNKSTPDNQKYKNSLGFFLADLGYDVFLGNSRGNFYGRRHIRYNSNESRFWDFCFDEKIIYDLPATIQYIRQLTNSTKISYVGFSQGAAMMFGLMADQPEYAELVEPFISFGPVAYVDNAITPFRRFSFLTPFLEGRNGPFSVNKALVAFVATQVCSREVIQQEICANTFFLLAGFDEGEFDSALLPAYLCHMPSDTSVRNMVHYGQEIRSGRFAHFDFGLDANLAKYKRQTPPDYDLSKIRSKSMVLFTSENDWLASPKDVAHLLSDLKVKPYAIVNLTEIRPLYNHLDFVYGRHTGELINTRVHQYLKKFEANQ